MRNLPAPLALGEWFLYNAASLTDKDHPVVVLIAKNSAVNAILLHYVCRCFEAVRCLVIIHDKQSSPNIDLLKDAGNAGCKLEVSCSFISDKTSFNYAEEVKKSLKKAADIVIYVDEDHVHGAGETNTNREAVNQLERGAQSILSEDGVLLIQRTRLVDVTLGQGQKKLASNKSTKTAMLLGSWIESVENLQQVGSLNKWTSFKSVLEFYVATMRESESLSAKNPVDSKSKVVCGSSNVTVLTASMAILSFDFHWKHDGYVSESMRKRLEDNAWWPKGEFRNQGLENWERTRQSWLDVKQPAPRDEERPLINYIELVHGLLAYQRFQLPQRMLLSELIEVYVDIWDSQQGF